MPTASNSLASLIRTAIHKAGGAISFAQFMELALYCPKLGYYECRKEIGRKGDFFTSVSVGSLFGELLAFQFAEWLESKTENSPRTSARLQIVEAGAHTGQLALDILRALQRHRPLLFSKIQYSILEPSQERRVWQQQSLAEFRDQVVWFEGWTELPPVRGIIFSNELLDAFPVHLWRWSAKKRCWRERMVTSSGEEFRWAESKESDSPAAPRLALGLLSVLPDGYKMETSLDIPNWWRAAAEKLVQGRLLTIDYGLSEEELLRPERLYGTIRAYYQHRVSNELLANVGEQDITTHLNFTTLQREGEASGLRTEMFVSQAKFLTGIAAQTWKFTDVFGGWDSARAKKFQTLAHPEHLGRAFRVLVQSREDKSAR